MSDLLAAMVTYLRTKTDVTDLTSTRIRPDVLKQNETLPAIAIDEFATTHENVLSGAAGIYASRVRVDCYAQTRTGANSLAEEVREELQGYRGAMGSEFVHSVQLDGRIKDIVQQKDGSDLPLYRTRLAFRIHVTESIPSF